MTAPAGCAQNPTLATAREQPPSQPDHLMNIKLAATFKPFHAGEMDALRQKARPAAGDGRFERYKTTLDFDGLPGQVAHGFARK